MIFAKVLSREILELKEQSSTVLAMLRTGALRGGELLEIFLGFFFCLEFLLSSSHFKIVSLGRFQRARLGFLKSKLFT